MSKRSQLEAEGHIPIKHIQETLWRRGDLEFLLWPQQRPIWQAMDDLPPHIVEFVVLCARQFGKSSLGVLRALSRGIKCRDSCILIMGPDTKQTKDIVRPKMRFLTKTAPKGLIVQQKAENRYHVYHDLNPKASDYTEIIMGGMNENSTSQRGKTVQEIFVEEIGDQNGDNFVESMESDLGPALTHSVNGKITFLTTVPPIPDHPFVTNTMVEAEKNKAIKIYTIDDNIALTQAQYDACVSRAKGKHTTTFKREYLCQVVRDENRVVLPNWDQHRNVREVYLPDHLFMHTTFDWGGVIDKTCGVLHYYDYLRDIDVFWDEIVFEPLTPSSEIVGKKVINHEYTLEEINGAPRMRSAREMESDFLKIRDNHGIRGRFIDAPHQFVNVDLVKEHEYHASVPTKPDFKSSVNSLNERFSSGKAIIHPRCKFLILSARSGMFNKKKTDFDRSQALGHCDGIAAMMYAIRMRDTSNPYPQQIVQERHRETQVMIPAHVAQGQIATSMTVSGGVSPKRFGRHRSG